MMEPNYTRTQVFVVKVPLTGWVPFLSSWFVRRFLVETNWNGKGAVIITGMTRALNGIGKINTPLGSET